MPPFLGGGEMILNVTKEGFTDQRDPLEVRGGHPDGRRGGRARPRRATTSATSAWTRSAGPRGLSLTAYALRTLTERHGDTLTIHGPTEPAERGWRAVVHPTATCTPTTSPRCSTRPGSACAPATTAPSPSCAVLGVAMPPRGPRSTSTTTSPTSTHLAEALIACRRRLFGVGHSKTTRCPASKTSIARSSSTTTATPRNRQGWSRPPPARAGRGLQPAVRRRDRRLHCDVDDEASSTTCASAVRAAPSASHQLR